MEASESGPLLFRHRSGCVDLTTRGMIMGIVNVTPDSFSDGGKWGTTEAAIIHGLELAGQGADILDVGGESTRPGSESVPQEEELARVLPVIRGLRQATDRLISVDTLKPGVAKAALEAGADIINDVGGFRLPEMAEVAREMGAGCVVMHMQGAPRTMQQAPNYGNVVSEVAAFLAERHAWLTGEAGLHPEQLVYDPGIGFGKSLAHNLGLLKNLGNISPQGRPLLLGVSRKSFISKILENNDLGRREAPTAVLTAYGRQAGGRIFRVHSVKENGDALRMMEAILAG